MKKILLVFVLMVSISLANALFISEFIAEPDTAEPGAHINVSASIFSEKINIQTNLSIISPTGTQFVLPFDIYSNFMHLEMPQPKPYNVTGIGKEYNLTLDCWDFTDNSPCWATNYSFEGACVNATFDDNPYNGDADLDIGVIACVEETPLMYTVNFSRWGYEAGHDIRARFCIRSNYMNATYCSDWILDGTDCAPECYDVQTVIVPVQKDIFGGFYKTQFTETNEPGTYHANLSVETPPDEFQSATTSFLIKDWKPPSFLLFSLNPKKLAVFEKMQINSVVLSQNPIEFVEARITGPKNETVLLTKNGDSYFGEYVPQIDGQYVMVLYARDIFNNSNTSDTEPFSVSAPLFPPTADKCHGILTIGLLNRNLQLSPQKARQLVNFNYYCTKNILGLWNYDFYIEILKQDGMLLEIDGREMAYGKMPDPTANIRAFNKKMIYATEATGAEIVELRLYLWA